MVQILEQNDLGSMLGGQIGSGIQSVMSQGLQMLIEAKIDSLSKRRELDSTSDLLSRTGHTKEQIDYFHSLPDEAKKSFLKSEVYPFLAEAFEEVKTSSARPKEPAGSLQGPLDFLKAPIDVREQRTQVQRSREQDDQQERALGTQSAIERGVTGVAKDIGKSIKESFTPTPQDPKKVSAAENKLREKGVDSLSLNEVALIRPSKFKDLPKEELDKLTMKGQLLENAMRRSGVAASTPFIGKGLGEAARKIEGVEEAPRIAGLESLSRVVTETPFLFGGGTLAQSALFGGGALVDEVVQKAATGKDIDWVSIGVQGSIPGAFHLVSRAPSIFKKFLLKSEAPAEEFAKAAESAMAAGVDLEKAVVGDKASIKAWRDHTKTIGREEAKASRIFEEGKKAAPKAEVKAFEGKLKKFEKYSEEVAQDQEKLARLKESYSRKTPAGLAKEAERKAIASKALPKIEKEVSRLAKERGAIADELKIFKGTAKEKERINALLDMKVDRLKAAEEELHKQLYMQETGRARPTVKDLREQAKSAVEKLSRDVKDKELTDLLKFNEERAAKAAALKKKPGAPRSEFKDSFQKANETYKKAYEDRLKAISEELKFKKLNREATELLDKEKTVLSKRIKRLEGELDIHSHELGLRDLQKAKQTKEKVRELKPKAGPTKADSIRKNILAGKDAEKILKSNPDLKKVLEKEASKWHDRMAKEKNPGARAKVKRSGIPGIRALTRSIFGISISAGAASAIIEEMTGAKVPLSPVRFIRSVAGQLRTNKAASMSPSERIEYYKSLKKKGVSTARINKIREGVKKAA